MRWCKKNRFRIFLSLLALALVLQGVFLLSREHKDKDQYNQALGDMEKLVSLDEKDSSEAQKAVELYQGIKSSFEKVGQESKGSNLRAKSNYNLGAILAMEVFLGDVDQINPAIEKLQLSLRDGDDNLKAKLYLEILLKLKQELAQRNEEQNNQSDQSGRQPAKPEYGAPQP